MMLFSFFLFLSNLSFIFMRNYVISHSWHITIHANRLFAHSHGKNKPSTAKLSLHSRPCMHAFLASLRIPSFNKRACQTRLPRTLQSDKDIRLTLHISRCNTRCYVFIKVLTKHCIFNPCVSTWVSLMPSSLVQVYSSRHRPFSLSTPSLAFTLSRWVVL